MKIFREDGMMFGDEHRQDMKLLGIKLMEINKLFRDFRYQMKGVKKVLCEVAGAAVFKTVYEIKILYIPLMGLVYIVSEIIVIAHGRNDASDLIEAPTNQKVGLTASLEPEHGRLDDNTIKSAEDLGMDDPAPQLRVRYHTFRHERHRVCLCRLSIASKSKLCLETLFDELALIEGLPLAPNFVRSNANTSATIVIFSF